MISYGKQSINQDDIDAVVDVLKSNFLTQGPKVEEFENDLSHYCNVNFVKVVSNATSALHLAYLALGLTKNDIVWTVPNTFVATANAAYYCGALVEFIDIDAKTYNISVECLKTNSSLVHCNISHNGLTDGDMAVLTNAIAGRTKQQCCLKSIVVRGNNSTGVAVKKLEKQLKKKYVAEQNR